MARRCDECTLQAILALIALAKGEIKLGALLSTVDSSEVDEWVEQLTSEYVMSKQFLATILGAASAIRSRYEKFSQIRKSVKLADDVEMIFSPVAAGEAPSDRRAGVPRVF